MAAKAHIDIRTPTLFTSPAVLVLNAFGFLAFLPVLASFLVVSVLKLGWVTVALPVAALAVATFFLPLAFGNTYVLALARKLDLVSSPDEERFLVQLKLTPRVQLGLRAVLEDADDMGWLFIGPTGIRFQGDAVTLEVPPENIVSVKSRTIGWRGLFLSGPRLEFKVTGIGPVTALEFAERSSWTLPGSRRTARRMRASAIKAGLLRAA